MNLRWFFSKTVRQASAMRKHVDKLLNHQRDILSPQALDNVRGATGELGKAVAENSDAATLTSVPASTRPASYVFRTA